jgi:hypothetical protein
MGLCAVYEIIETYELVFLPDLEHFVIGLYTWTIYGVYLSDLAHFVVVVLSDLGKLSGLSRHYGTLRGLRDYRDLRTGFFTGP